MTVESKKVNDISNNYSILKFYKSFSSLNSAGYFKNQNFSDMQAQPHYTGLTQTLYFLSGKNVFGVQGNTSNPNYWGQSLFGLAKYTEITEGDFGVQWVSLTS